MIHNLSILIQAGGVVGESERPKQVDVCQSESDADRLT